MNSEKWIALARIYFVVCFLACVFMVVEGLTPITTIMMPVIFVSGAALNLWAYKNSKQ